MTSNLGSSYLQAENLRTPEDFEKATEQVTETLHGHFRPEFLNRVDDIIIFRPLGKEQLVKIVELRLEDLRRLLADRKLRRTMESFTGVPLTRPPKGFPKDHPAMDLLLCRQWGVEATLAPKAALQNDLATEVIRRFRLAAPLVNALNTPLLASIEKKRRPLFGL